jgi:hypothetical protein
MLEKIPMKIKLIVFAIALIIAIIVVGNDRGLFGNRVTNGTTSNQGSINAP